MTRTASPTTIGSHRFAKTRTVAVVYDEAGRRTVRIEACDALNQCAMLDVDIDVAQNTLPPSL